jgi:hypothetical protein
MKNDLVCEPADSPLTIPGSSFNRACVKCNRRVMISPRGQQVLATMGDLFQVVCRSCARPGGFIGALQTTASIDPVPNMRRYRN